MSVDMFYCCGWRKVCRICVQLREFHQLTMSYILVIYGGSRMPASRLQVYNTQSTFQNVHTSNIKYSLYTTLYI